MARTTGPILAMGAITVANQTIIHNQPIDWRIPIATGLAAGIFALLEKGNEGLAVGLAWLALFTTLIIRIDPKTPAPIESLADFTGAK